MLIFAAHAAASVAVIPLNGAGGMKNKLANTLAYWQYDTFVFVKVVDFKRDTVDIARVNPASIKTHGHTVASPTGAAFYFAGAAMGANTDKLVRMRQNSFTRLQYDNRVIFGDVLKQLHFVFLAPFFVRNCFKRTFKVTCYVALIKRIVNAAGFWLIFLLVKIMPQRKIEAGLAHVALIKRHTHYRAIRNARGNLCIAIYSHNFYLVYHSFMKTMIVAYDKKRGIGAENDLLWGRNLPADLAQFKKRTMGKSIIMGRKTFESIGARPLPGRQNIVVSSTPTGVDGVITCASLEAAYAMAQFEPVVIGGGQLYEAALAGAERIYATEVQAEFAQATVFFPELSTAWRETSREHHEADERNAYAFDLVVYECATPQSAPL